MPRLAIVRADDPDTIDSLLPSFGLSLRAAARSPRTVILRTSGARRFAAWLAANGCSTAVEAVTPDDVRGYLVSLADAGKAGNTITTAHAAIRGFYAWAIGEGIAASDPTARVRAPRVVQPVTPVFTDDELKRLFAACAGTSFTDRRDHALLRFVTDTGVRRAELTALRVEDVDTQGRVAVIRRGKGGKPRVVAFGDRTGTAIDRYLRTRKAHRHADSPWLWLGRSSQMTYGSIRDAIAMRAERAGVQGAHLHRFRHTFASRWLSAGGNEGDLMALGGWSSARMIHNTYGAATRADRALDAAHRIGLGDRL